MSGVPAVGSRLAGNLAAGGGSVARCLSVGGRTARATAAAPFPRTRRQAVPAVTHPGDRACKSGRAVLLALGILSPRKDHRQERLAALASFGWRERHS
jgi:hypothetical protein